MRKTSAPILALLLCFCTTVATAAGKAKPKGPAADPKPTQEVVIALAKTCSTKSEPKLEDQDKTVIEDMKADLAQAKKAGDAFYKPALKGCINQLTLKLAGAKSLDGLMVASTYLVTEHPKNLRALNLFGSVLHTYDKPKDAILVFSYALSIEPNNNVVKLNLANSYLDNNQDAKAKPLLDKLEFEDSGNKAVYRALATYYYRQKNAARFREYLFKAATFKGFKKAKVDKKKKIVDDNEVTLAQPTDLMETKLKELAEIVPLTTADVIEEDYPDAAQKIRNKYGKLAENEKWILPKLPMVNLNGPPDFERNKPIVEEWIQVAAEKFKVFPIRQAQAMGIDTNASEKVIEAQAQKAARKKMAEALQQAQQSLKYMENIPGVSKADIAKAKAELKKLTQKENIKLEDKPVDTNAPPPGVDSGSLFAADNYYNFTKIQCAYSIYFMKYHKEFRAKLADIMKVYGQKVEEENKRWAKESEELADQHSDSLKNSSEGPHSGVDQPCRQALINHKKLLNAISDNYYRQWSNLYMPQYAQKMKPTLDAYFNVCMLHIRNMNDPKVMETAYNQVTMTYMTYSMQSMSYIGMGGFDYYPETDEEQRQLDHDVAVAKEEAESKKEVFKREFKSPEFSFTDWVDDHFVMDISGEFLSLKFSSKSIEFEAYVPGVSAGAKYDFSEQKFETFTGVGAKLDIGVNICGLGAKAEAGGEVWRRTATWDLMNGKYYETDTGKAAAKGSFGPVEAAGEFQLDAQLTAKVTGTVSLMGATVQGEKTLN